VLPGLVNLTGHFWLTKPVFNRILAPGRSFRAGEVFVKVRNDWARAQIEERVGLPFVDLLFRARRGHSRFHVPNFVQVSALACRPAVAS
jgi:hypothetical protein